MTTNLKAQIERSQEIRKIMSELFDLTDKIKKVQTYYDLVTWPVLENWQLGEIKEMPNGVFGKKTEEGSDSCTFICRFPPRTAMRAHAHDFEEIVTVIQGEMRDYRMPQMSWTKGRSIKYNALRIHHPYNPSHTEDLILEVKMNR